MRIGDAARQLGVHPDTLRNMERRGLFTPARDWSGQRRYSAEDLDKLRAQLFPKRGAEPRATI